MCLLIMAQIHESRILLSRGKNIGGSSSLISTIETVDFSNVTVDVFYL